MRYNSLAVYTLKFREVKTYKDMVDMTRRLGECFNGLNGKTDADEDISKSYRIWVKKSDDHEVGGIIESGHFGTGNPIVDVKTGVNTYDKKKNESDFEPHYFLIMSKGFSRNSGFLISERLGNDGIETILLNKMRSCLGGIFPETGTTVTKEEMSERMEQLSEIRLVKYVPNADLANEVKEGMDADQGLYLEFRIKAEKGKGLSNYIRFHVREFLTSPNAKGIYVVAGDLIRSGYKKDEKKKETIPYDFDFILADVLIGNTKKTIKVMKGDAMMRPYYPLPDTIPKDDKGWPKFEEADKFAKKLVDDILSERTPSVD